MADPQTRSFSIRIQLLQVTDTGRAVTEDILEEDGCSAYETLVPFKRMKQIYLDLSRQMTHDFCKDDREIS